MMQAMLLLLTTLALAEPPHEAPTPDALPALRQFEGVQLLHETLDNGLQITVAADRRWSVTATQVWFHVGSAAEAQNQLGLAHLFEHLMFGQTDTHAAKDYATFHTQHGGSENASTSFDETVYVSTMPPSYNQAVLDFEADRFMHIQFSDDTLAKEQKVVMEELRVRTQNDAFSRLANVGSHAFFGDHPYGHWPTGTQDDIEGTTLQGVEAFFDTHYRPDRAHIVVAGPVDPIATYRAIRDRFEGWERGSQPAAEVPPLIELDLAEPIELQEDIPPVEVAAYIWTLPGQTHPDAPALELLFEALEGGQINPVRELMVEDHSWAVEATSMSFTFKAGSIIGIGGAFVPYRTQKRQFKFLDKARARLDALEWLSDEAIEQARRRLLRGLYSRRFFPYRTARDIGQAVSWGQDAASGLEHAKRLEQVSAEQVREAYRLWIASREPTTAVIKPEHIPLGIRLFGWLYPLVNR